MVKIDKKLNITVISGTYTQRMADVLSDPKGVKAPEVIRRWCSAGFLLQEIGGGVASSLMDMEQNGELAGMTAHQRATVLINLLSRVSGTEQTVIKHQEPSEPAEQVTPEPPPKPAPLRGPLPDYSVS